MTKYIGFGYNCDVTEILTRGGLRNESYPFDWTYSLPDEIKKSLDRNFDDWLNPKYLSLVLNSTSGKIVTSHSQYSSHERLFGDLRVVFFNHHNLLDPVDRAKINRRIHRYRSAIRSDDQVVFITNASKDSIKEAGLDAYCSDMGARIIYIEHCGPGEDSVKLSEINNDILISYISDGMHGDNVSRMICKEITNIFGN